MRYIAIGTVSSETEWQQVVERAEGHRVYELVELVKTIDAAEKRGFRTERKRWAEVPDEEAVKVYSGQGSATGAVWAAIEVGSDDMTLTLLKIVDSFSGGQREADDLLADALHRRNRSRRP